MSSYPRYADILASGSKSIRARAAPRFTVVVVFSTPPFWLATAIIFYSFSCSLFLKFIFYFFSSSSSLSILATHNQYDIKGLVAMAKFMELDLAGLDIKAIAAKEASA